MELLQQSCPIIELYAKLKTPLAFSLVDVGCSGGIDKIFKELGVMLKALGIDASVDEIEKLRRENMHDGIKYIDGLVIGLSEEIHLTNDFVNSKYWINNPWERLSVHRTLKIRSQHEQLKNHEEKMFFNRWFDTKLSSNHFTLPNALIENDFLDVDLLKIDIDGPDFAVMQALHKRFDEFGILAVVMEVCYAGSHNPTDNTFHNTDRFMRENGFELYGLTTRPYSMASLPFRYQWGFPAQTTGGRPMFGDALYVRDICSVSYPIPNKFLSPEKIINAIFIFSLFGLPDCAAELLLNYQEMLAPFLDTTEFLDALTRQSISMQRETPQGISSYKELMDMYESDSSSFYMASEDDPYKTLLKEHEKLTIGYKKLSLEYGKAINLDGADMVIEKLLRHRIIWFLFRISILLSEKLYKLFRKQ